jgi:hypothetical protein
MARFRRGGSRALAGFAALAVVALAAGCDWLKGSDLILRSSPFLSGLGIPATALCDNEFFVSFTYDDPQGDISSVGLVLQHGDDASTLDASTFWDDAFDRGSGSASYPVTFPCSAPGGEWTITVTVQDDLGHTSNALTGTILLSGGG